MSYIYGCTLYRLLRREKVCWAASNALCDVFGPLFPLVWRLSHRGQRKGSEAPPSRLGVILPVRYRIGTPRQATEPIIAVLLAYC